MSRNIIQVWLVVNVWSGAQVLQQAVGPRDALFAVGGWGRFESRDGWAWGGDWRVRLVPVQWDEMRVALAHPLPDQLVGVLPDDVRMVGGSVGGRRIA